MGGKRQPLPAEFAAQGEAVIRTALLKRRRTRSREYMKQWRANPKHRELERERRDRDYTFKKQRRARRLLLRPYTRVDGRPQCGFCGQGRPVEIVERLRISETADEEYERVLIPYCGHC
ncbi:MAG: hypothetical protein WCD43_08570 [Candidatus Acidiferrales bacterium]